MRIVHFADNHLGAGVDRRQQDILDSFAEAVDKIIALKPDLVINAGDLFDMVHPPNRIIAFAAEQLMKLGRKARIPTVVISGNHDAPKQTHIAAVLSIFKDFENIYVVHNSRYERISIGNCSISAVPHCLTTEILKTELDKITPDSQAEFNILVLHGVVGGIKEFQMADLSEQEISADYFKRGFDYVALGHYHNYKAIRSNEIENKEIEPMVYYSGSTERLSQSEAPYKKGFIEANLRTRAVVFHEIQSRVMLDLPAVKTRGRSPEEIVDELERLVKAHQPEDKIIRVTLADIPEETYRALPFDRIAALKNEAFSLDIRFEKEEKPEDNLFADLNLGRLDLAFEKFLESQSIENLDRDTLKKIAFDFLRRAEYEDI